MHLSKRERERRGFTLIELLVAISIIGMLASVALTSLNSSRLEAEHSAVFQTVNQYLFAIDAIHTSLGYYPMGEANIAEYSNGQWCLSQNQCAFGAEGPYALSPIFTSLFSSYLPSLPGTPNVTIYNSVYNGIFYSCDTWETFGMCTTIYITYYIRGITTCPQPRTVTKIVTVTTIPFVDEDFTVCQIHLVE